MRLDAVCLGEPLTQPENSLIDILLKKDRVVKGHEWYRQHGRARVGRAKALFKNGTTKINRYAVELK
jgi:hypothetical protein